MATISKIKRAKSKAVGGKKDRCLKGKSCSATCISGWKACLVEMSSLVSKHLSSVKGRVESGVKALRETIKEMVPGAERRRILERESKVKPYRKVVGMLASKLEDAAERGDRAGYQKVERVLMKVQDRAKKRLNLDPLHLKGSIWRDTRIKMVEDKLISDMMKAIVSNDKGRFNKLHNKLNKIVYRAGLFNQLGSNAKEAWSTYKGMAHFVTRLEKAGVRNGREAVSGIRVLPASGYKNQTLKVISRVRGNIINVKVEPNSLSFTVNGSILVGGDLPKAEKVAIIREVRRQFSSVFKSFKEGTVLTVGVAEGDGRGDARAKAYANEGFSNPNAGGGMFGKVKGGKIVPISEDEFDSKANNSFM